MSGEPKIMWCSLCWGTGTDLDYTGPCQICEGTGHFNTETGQVTAIRCDQANCVGCHPEDQTEGNARGNP